MLRERAASHDPLGEAASAIMKSGGLVSDEIVNKMVEERIEQPDCVNWFILDGYPRTVNQAKLISGVLAAKRIETVVVHLKVDYNVIIARLSGRRLCPTCGALYGVSAKTPVVSEVCDYDGSKLVVRDDDRPEVVAERLKAYDRQTSPVLECLRGQGFAVCEVDGGASSPLVIAKKIREWIDSRRGNGKSKLA
jgi:adenylate kinase